MSKKTRKKHNNQGIKTQELSEEIRVDDKVRCILKHDSDEVFIRVNIVYAQIAKYNGNQNRKQELSILNNALKTLEKRKWLENVRYVKMKKEEAVQCFGDNPPTMTIPTVLRIASPILVKD